MCAPPHTLAYTQRNTCEIRCASASTSLMGSFTAEVSAVKTLFYQPPRDITALSGDSARLCHKACAEPGTVRIWSPSQAPHLVTSPAPPPPPPPRPSHYPRSPTWGQEKLQAQGEKSKDVDELR